METEPSDEKGSTRDDVRNLPLRNGNHSPLFRNILPFLVRNLPLRNGNSFIAVILLGGVALEIFL